MPTIVDGDNLLGSWAGRSRSDDDRRLLARQIARLARSRRRRILVVFDGPGPPAARSGPDAIFAGPAQSADERILAILSAESDRRGFTVVTNDRALADRCRHLGVKIERCGPFRERLLSRDPSEKPESSDDLEYWSKVFRAP